MVTTRQTTTVASVASGDQIPIPRASTEIPKKRRAQNSSSSSRAKRQRNDVDLDGPSRQNLALNRRNSAQRVTKDAEKVARTRAGGQESIVGAISHNTRSSGALTRTKDNGPARNLGLSSSDGMRRPSTVTKIDGQGDGVQQKEEKKSTTAPTRAFSHIEIPLRKEVIEPEHLGASSGQLGAGAPTPSSKPSRKEGEFVFASAASSSAPQPQPKSPRKTTSERAEPLPIAKRQAQRRSSGRSALGRSEASGNNPNRLPLMQREPKTADSTLPVSKGAHTRFDTDHPDGMADPPGEKPIEQQPTPPQDALELHTNKEEVADSSDDAPEAVSRASAMSRKRVLDEQVARAVQTQKKARRAKKSSKSIPEAIPADPVIAAVQPSPSDVADSAPPSPDNNIDASDNDPSVITSPSPPPTSKLLPDLLPDAIFDDLEQDTPVDAVIYKHPKPQRKVFSNEERPAKDVSKGPLRIRVLESRSAQLAPRASRQSVDLKGYWLEGRTAAAAKKAADRGGRWGKRGGGVRRMEVRSGFFR